MENCKFFINFSYGNDLSADTIPTGLVNKICTHLLHKVVDDVNNWRTQVEEVFIFHGHTSVRHIAEIIDQPRGKALLSSPYKLPLVYQS